LVAEAAGIALRLGHPLADCLYLALAIELDCDLATCDAKFQARASSAYPRVQLLSEFN
jgi:predicted nucleic acid-binding protein